MPCPSPGDLPNPRIKPRTPALRVHSFPSAPPGKPAQRRDGSEMLFSRGLSLRPRFTLPTKDSPYLSNRQMLKTDSEYLRLAVKMCQKKNDSSPMTNKVFFSNWVRRILLSEMQSLKVVLQVFLCNTKQNQTSGKGQEPTRNKEGNTHTHTHTHTHPHTQNHGRRRERCSFWSR